MEIRLIDSGNICKYMRDIAEIHKLAYSDAHFSSLLSVEKLAEYYKSLVCSSDISLVSIIDGKVVGFIVSGENISNGVNYFISQNKKHLLSVFIFNPRFIASKLFDKLEQCFHNDFKSRCKYRLMSISVSNVIQSKGVGITMINELESQLIDRGVTCYGLSVKAKNERALSFYEKNGFVLEREVRGSKFLEKKIMLKSI